MCARVASVPARLPAFNQQRKMLTAKDKVDEVFRPYLLCSENIGSEEELFLENYFSVVRLPAFSALQDAVASHADMLLCHVGDQLAVHPIYYAENRELFETRKINTVQIRESAGKKYPEDILLNGLFLSDKLYGLTDKLSKTLTDYASDNVFVRQGYTRCSVCKINEHAIITADVGISRAAKQHGADVLLISPGHISLKGCDYGFIGGASVTYKSTVFFFGRIEDHPDFDKMRDFAENHGANLVSASKNPLCDIGGGVVCE